MKTNKNLEKQKLSLGKVRVTRILTPEAILGGDDDKGRTGEVSKGK